MMKIASVMVLCVCAICHSETLDEFQMIENCLLIEMDYGKALSMIDGCLETDGGNSRLLYYKALAFTLRKEYDRSLSILESLHAKSDKNVKVLVLMASNCWLQLEYAPAKNKGDLVAKTKRYLDEAYAIDKNDFDTLAMLGEYHRFVPGVFGIDHGKALSFFRKADEAAPENIKTKYLIAELLVSQKKYKEAEKYVDAGIGLVEEGKARIDALNRFHYYWIFFQRGVIYFNTRSVEDALPCFLFHVKNVEDSEWGHFYLGVIYQKQGLADRARTEYGLCLKYAALKNNEYAVKTVSRLLSE